MLQMKETNLRLIWWVLLLEEFDLEMRDKKCSKNAVADHLSRLVNIVNEAYSYSIQESFPDEQHFQISIANLPWFVVYVNFLINQFLLLNISP